MPAVCCVVSWSFTSRSIRFLPSPAMISSTRLSSSEAARLLVQAVQQISTARTIEEIVELVTHTARQGSGADGVSFVLREGDLCYYVDEDAVGPLWKGRRFPMP